MSFADPYPELQYAPRLYTPHYLQAGRDDVLMPLMDAIEPDDIANDLYNEQEIDPADDTSSLAATDFIIQQVHKALWFPQTPEESKELGVSSPPVLDDLVNKQVADCFGFTIVASECLEAAAVNHWVGFANGHATLVLNTHNGRRLNLSDPLSPDLNQDLTAALIEGPDTNIEPNIAEYGRTAIMLDTHKIVAGMRKQPPYPFQEHPWLHYGQDAEAVNSWHETRRLRATKVVMSLMEPQRGRQAIADYGNLQHAMREKDYERAVPMMDRIGNFFPDMDARQHHLEIRRLMLEMGKAKRIPQAKAILNKYFETFVFIDDSRFNEAHADCLKILAREGEDPETCEEATSYYDKALESPKSYSGAIEAKRLKVKDLYARLKPGSKEG